MKLIEIKNNLAKLYYEPSDFKIVLSDFLTIDDGNQKILSQVVSVETTSKDSTNCAVIKFSLDLNDDGTYSAYSGYVPTLDALVSKTPLSVIKKIFSNGESDIVIGQLTSSTNAAIALKSELLDSFLYIQADRHECKKEIISKILEFNAKNDKKTIYFDFDNIDEFEGYKTVTLGKEFKLPIGTEILNYIYENDLTGLTVEQKTIVQDIILEIQDYINSLETGYIPFDALLNVVNDIYEEDKSVGVILFRNKLLKYKQLNIFASTEEEIVAVDNALSNNTVIIAKFHRPEANWKNEALNFLMNFIEEKYYLIAEADDEVITKDQFAKMYKCKNINPIIFSKYDIATAGTIKAYAKNLILYKPQTQQRAFATYNSFLNKLAEKEFIVSGECTCYTPLIIKELSEEFVYSENNAIEQEDITQKIQEIKTESSNNKGIVLEPLDNELVEDIEQNLGLEEDDLDLIESAENSDKDFIFGENDVEVLIGEEEENEFGESQSGADMSNILEETIEDAIAKDVDQMFYAEMPENTANEADISEDNLVNIDVELVNQMDASEDMLNEGLFDSNTDEDFNFAIEDNTDEMLLSGDLDFIDSIDSKIEIEDPDILEEPQKTFVDIEPVDNYDFGQKTQTTVEEPSSIPVYKTELDNETHNSKQVEIAEGNIVYHEKYGRGVVEQFMNYGNKTFCSVLFDNVGRRLMDPKLAGLKQM